MTVTNSSTYISNQLSKLDIIPKNHTDVKNHLFADFIELTAFFSSDEISLNDILRKYQTENITIKKAVKNEDELGLVDSEEKDNAELWIKGIFQLCEYRNDILDMKYPFVLSYNTIILKDEITEKQKIYLSLLLSSNLDYFPYFQSYLTKDFERISYESLKGFLPTKSMVKQFGKNSDYSGNAQSKIKALAKDLNINTEDKIIKNTVRGNQEKGLDIIGWIPFSDRVPNFVSVFGQCACGKDWHNKKGETKRYLKYFKFYGNNLPIQAMFIPYAQIKNSDSIYQEDDLDDTLLFERFRILEYIEEDSFFQKLASKEIVESCLEY